MEKETLEEVAERLARAFDNDNYKALMQLVEDGAEWQAERMYSEEEVIFFIKEALNYSSLHYNRVSVDDWFEQFSKLKNG